MKIERHMAGGCQQLGRKKHAQQSFCFSQQKTYFTGSGFHLLEAQNLGSFFVHVELCTLRLGLNLQVEGTPAREMPLPQHQPTEESRVPLTAPFILPCEEIPRGTPLTFLLGSYGKARGNTEVSHKEVEMTL